MAETETVPPPVPVTTGISMKMLIIIVAGTLVLGLGGAFAFFKLMAGVKSTFVPPLLPLPLQKMLKKLYLYRENTIY